MVSGTSFNAIRGRSSAEKRWAAKPPLSRFWRSVTKTEGCWLWTAGGDGEYGALYVNGKRIKAHRYSWVIHYGAIPNGLWVLHHCDNPACVRPDHLFLGDNGANIRDAVKKGRHNPKGCALRTMCRNGHPYVLGSYRLSKEGWRKCLVCINDCAQAVAAVKGEK